MFRPVTVSSPLLRVDGPDGTRWELTGSLEEVRGKSLVGGTRTESVGSSGDRPDRVHVR